MTEGTRETVLDAMPRQPSYEQVIQAVPHSGFQEIMRHAKIDEQHLNRELAAIEANEDLTPEAKERSAQELIDRYGPKISERYRDAREKVETSAQSSYKFSIPMPGEGKTLATTRVADANELLAVQNETTQILTRAEQAQAAAKRGPKPSQDPRRRVIKEAYARALENDGIEGKAQALGAIKAAESLGIDLETLVADHRQDKHTRALAEANHFERAAFALPKDGKTIRNPFDTKRRDRRRIGTYSGGGSAVVGRGSGQLFPQQRRKPAWK